MAIGVRGFMAESKLYPANAFSQYYTTVMQVLYFYDYLLTLPDEVWFTLYLLIVLSLLRRSSTPGRGEKRGVSP